MTNNISAKQALFYILTTLRPFKLSIGVMGLTAVAWAISMSLQPYILKVILDRINSLPGTGITGYLILPICAYLGRSFVMLSIFRLYGYFVELKMIPLLRSNLASSNFEKLIDQSNKFYQNNFAGSLANKIGDLTSSVPELIQIFMDRFVSHSIGLCIAIFTLWQVNIKFAIANLIWCTALIIAAFFCSKHLTRLAANYSEVGSKLTGKYVDVFSNILSVRLFAKKPLEMKSINIAFAEAVSTEQKLQWLYFWIWSSSGFSYLVIQGVCLYYLMQGLEQGWVTVGDFALVLTINIAIVDCLWELTRDFSQFTKHFGRVMQALHITMQEPEIQDKPGAEALLLNSNDITFNNISFYYHGSKPLFQNLSLTIPSGQKVGLVGYSGGGKTTLVNLILRIYDLSEGSIKIGEQDISSVTQDSLRQNISMIPQDPALFHRSLMENIRYGMSDATDQQVINAAIKAHANEFIEALPQGYDSLVGERGVKLSGGQRQRIAIARAILKDAPILILDEATSQLDSVTENYIQESLLALMESGGGKTTLIIAHRLSTLLSMDRIIVFDKGLIVEDGTHNQLTDKGGLYKKLWDAQVGGFLPEYK